MRSSESLRRYKPLFKPLLSQESISEGYPQELLCLQECQCSGRWRAWPWG